MEVGWKLFGEYKVGRCRGSWIHATTNLKGKFSHGMLTSGILS